MNMRNVFLLCVLLLVEGVSGDEKLTVTVMEGDSVTLKPDDAEIPEKDLILWKFNNDDNIIAKRQRYTEPSITAVGLERFTDRLKLDHKTGFLTITNTTTKDSGVYLLNIKGSKPVLKIYNVTVSDGSKSVSVTEGDTVSLHTGFIKKQTDHIQWKSGDQDLNGWSDQTGDLTISNIQREQSGVYELEINTSSMILHRKLSINIIGEMNTESVMEGEPIILYTGVIEIQGYDQILWKFDDHLIVEFKKVANQFLRHDSSAGGKFKGRLMPSEQSGSLTIRNSRTTDSGVYHLQMSSNSHTVQRSISVTVSGSGRSGAVSWISGASFGLMVWAVTVFFLQEV